MSVINAGNKGLVNLGNTCYMNSALQCLSHLLIFHPHNERFHAEKEFSNTDDLFHVWYEFQREIWSNDDDRIVNPEKVLRAFQRGCSENKLYFENFDQNDADEFLTLFLDLMHRGIKRKIDTPHRKQTSSKYVKKAQEVWDRFYKEDYSYIVHNFHSQGFYLTSCPECKYSTTNHDPIHVISLEIPSEAKTIDDCLKEHTKTHTLDGDNLWTCDNCRRSVNSYKRNLLWKTSEIFIILLKRYRGGRKITRNIDYAPVLDIKPYSMNYTHQETKYALQSVSVHEGSLGGGHYYAYCHNHLDSKWRCHNDTSVKCVNLEEVLNSRPYLLFYKRL
jgi:ubiquitin C-terminal hydrolase